MTLLCDSRQGEAHKKASLRVTKARFFKSYEFGRLRRADEPPRGLYGG